jgi:xanthine dehydrogenase YagR molybdenum-binding subunit
MNFGQAIDRKDGHLKVTGQAKYAAEFAAPNMAHAVMVQSTIAAGTVASYELKDAQGMPGVLAILTPSNAGTLHVGAPAALLRNKTVLYNGETIALVIADTLQRAQAAAAAVRVHYTEGEAATHMDAVLHNKFEPKEFANGRAKPDSAKGDAESALRQSATRVDARYITPIEHHNPMEPHATIARWDGDKLTVWTTTQGISAAQKSLAAMFELDPKNVTVVCPFVGGGFGCKGNTWPPAILAAMAARQVGRPVKLEVTREQMFTSNGYRPRTIQHVQLGADAQGKLLAVSHDALTQNSAPEVGEFAEPVGLIARMLYASPNIATSHRLVGVNQGLPTFMRAPGEASGSFALESAMDELAVAAKIDPMALRLSNYTDHDATDGKPFASKGLRACYEKGAAAFGWDQRTAEPSSMRDGRTLIGWGMATTTYPTNRMASAASVRLLADGTALVRSGTQDIGTGTYTTMAQIAGDELGLPTEKVHAELGDSRFPAASISGGSMTSASVLPAVQEAARQAKAKLIGLAMQQRAEWHNLEESAFTLRDGAIHHGDDAVPVGSILQAAGVDHVEGHDDAKPSPDADKYSRHSFGAHFAEVRIDPDLRTIRVSRWVGAFDCGRLINAKTGRSQLIGGIVFGIGMALMEETRVDIRTGRYVNANIADYLVPVCADVPEIETIAIDAPDTISSPLGIKGIGELPTVGVAAAIANAVYHATGIRVRELPIRLDKILA